MTAHLWPAAWAQPVRVPSPTPRAAHGAARPGRPTPPMGLDLGDVARPPLPPATPPAAAETPEGGDSSTTRPRPYLAALDAEGAPRVRRRDPLPRELARPVTWAPAHGPLVATSSESIAVAGYRPDAATRLGAARGVAQRMHHDLETHGRRALAVMQNPEATPAARADADAQLTAWRTGILAVEAVLAAMTGAPSASCDLPPELRPT